MYRDGNVEARRLVWDTITAVNFLVWKLWFLSLITQLQMRGYIKANIAGRSECKWRKADTFKPRYWQGISVYLKTVTHVAMHIPWAGLYPHFMATYQNNSEWLIARLVMTLIGISKNMVWISLFLFLERRRPQQIAKYADSLKNTLRSETCSRIPYIAQGNPGQDSSAFRCKSGPGDLTSYRSTSLKYRKLSVTQKLFFLSHFPILPSQFF